MRLHRRFVVYLAAVHLLCAAVALPLLVPRPVWLLVAEGLLLLSLAVGVRLVGGLFRTLDIIQDGAEFLREGDFTSRLRETGRPELDRLVGVYNRMIDHLRDERTRLQEQHHFLAQVLEQSPSAILVLDFDGAIELSNPAAARLLDLDAAGLRGRKLGALAGPVAEALGGLGPGETRVVALPDGRRLRCRRGSFQDRGFARGFLMVEELTEELRQAEKAAYENLIRMMSHEVNNSVGATSSLLHSCLNYRPFLPDEEGKDFEEALRVVIRRTEQLGSLMRSFAEVVRLPPPQRRPVDLPDLLRNVAVLMRAECERRRVQWVWAIEEPPPPPVAVDPTQMEQVLVNVVKNALEAIGEDGTVTARLGRRGGRVFLAIEDTGPGIPPEVRAQLFTPFFSTKQTGQGVGLTLVQQVLTQHQLDYALESPPGGPTRFTITFR